MTLRHEAARPAVQAPGKRVWCAAASLAAYAMLAPLTVAALAGPLPLRGFGTLALAVSLLGPGLATILACWRGLGAIAEDLAGRGDEEPQQALLRLVMTAVMLAYVSALAVTGLAVQPLVAIYVAAALAAWLILLHCIVAPASRLRRAAALASDVVIVGVFLHWGDRATAPWVVVYLALAFDHGMRFGAATLIAAALGSAVGFAAVAATTPLWQEMPLADVVLFGAFMVLPLYGAALVHRAAAARHDAATLRNARQRLLAVLGHELRTPLNTLLGLTALLARSRLDGAQHDLVATAQLAARSLLGVVGDLSETDDGAPPERSFVLREALSGAVAILRPQAEAKGLELSFVLDPRLPHVCRGSPALLRRLLTSLLAGAIARAAEGQVALAATLAEREPGEMRLRLAVRHDASPGTAPPPELDGIAQLFAQADAPDAAPGDGALGRAIAIRLVEHLGGSIAIDPDGSAVTVELPLAYDESAAATPPDLLGRKVAIVTADRELAERLQLLLAAWRGDAHWLPAGEEALALLGGGAPLIAVIDGRLDPLAALSLAHRLATGPEPAAILFIAPRAASAAVAGLAAAQLAAVIEEPVTETALANAVSSVAATAAAEPTHAAAVSLSLLVADDDETSRERMRLLLERSGHKVELAADGGAALAALDKGGFDAALIELDMPGVSGDAVAKLHRLRHPGGILPLIALASHASGETEVRCRDAGFDGVLKRPFDLAQLGAALAAARTARAMAASAPAPAAPDVTHISAHPRFLGEAAETIRETTLESLRGLGGNDFLAEVVETFRSDAARLAPRLRQAAERGDLAQFAEFAHALRSGAANIGGVRLTQTLTALEDLTEAELRQAGMAYVEKIEAELARLELALEPFLRSQRRG